MLGGTSYYSSLKKSLLDNLIILCVNKTLYGTHFCEAKTTPKQTKQNKTKQSKKPDSKSTLMENANIERD